MTVHELKIWPVHFEPVKAGAKRAELRKDDRTPSFAVGDVLKLEEYDPDLLAYTEEVTYKRVTHVARGGVIPEGFALLSIGAVNERPGADPDCRTCHGYGQDDHECPSPYEQPLPFAAQGGADLGR